MAETVRIEMPIKAVDNTGPALSNITNKLNKIGQAAQNVQSKVSSTAKTVSRFDKTLEKTQKSLSSWMSEKYEVYFGAKDELSPILSIIHETLKNVSNQIWHITIKAVDLVTSPVERIIGSLKNSLNQEGAVLDLSFSVNEAVDPYTKIEMIMSQAKEMVDSYQAQWEQMIGTSKEMGTANKFNDAEPGEVDLLGNVKIAWDEIIGKPFSDWWDSKGHDLIAKKVVSIGQEIGSAIADGLNEGFDINGLRDKIKELISSGGEEDESSWTSSFKVMDKGISYLSTFLSAAKLWKELSGTPTTAGRGSVSPLQTSASASSGVGTILLPQTVISTGSDLATASTTYAPHIVAGASKAGGASLSAGALNAAGLGASAGAVVAGTTIISGAEDLYKGFTSENSEESGAYILSGGVKIGATGAGAKIGATIGTALGPVGTLIGAGIGGLAGWIIGEGIKNNYEELALAEEQAKYESQELKDALADTSMTAEEFQEKFQKAVGENLKRHFGDIKLSMEEIQAIAKDLTFRNNFEGASKFSGASQQSELAYNNKEASIANMDKLNWKVNVGYTLDETDQQEYINGIDNLINSSKEYVENRHFEAQAAIDLLVDPTEETDMTTGLNAVYIGLQEQLNSLGTELNAKVEVALEDGVITTDEQAELTNLQDQMNEITQKVTQAQTEAEFKALKIKYSGANMDPESFASLQAELQEQVATATQTYDEALKVGISNLELQLSEGAISQEQYDEQLQVLADGYETKISDMELSVENFQLETIAESYAAELAGILPDIEGTTAEKLKTAMQNAMASGVDVQNWDVETAAKWLDLEGLSEESQSAIAEMMSNVAANIPQSAGNEIISLFQDTDLELEDTGILEKIQGVFSNLLNSFGLEIPMLGTNVVNSIGTSIDEADKSFFTVVAEGIKNSFDGEVGTKFSDPVNTTAAVNVTADYNLTNPTATINVTGAGTGSVKIGTSITAQANGDIITGPLLSLVGEDGPEAIIPLGSKRRSRGLSLWEKAGEMLGVRKYADGGLPYHPRYSSNPLENSSELKFINDSISKAPRGYNDFSEENSMEDIPSKNLSLTSESTDNGKPEVTVQVQLSPNFEINSNKNDADDVMLTIRAHMKDLVDEFGGELAIKLGRVFENMPLKEV